MAAMFEVGVARSSFFRIEWRAAHQQQTRPSFVANKRKPGAHGFAISPCNCFSSEGVGIHSSCSLLPQIASRATVAIISGPLLPAVGNLCKLNIDRGFNQHKNYFTGVLPELYPQVRRSWSCRALEMKKEARSIEIEIRTCVDDYNTILNLLWAALTYRTAFLSSACRKFYDAGRSEFQVPGLLTARTK
jgi:hypothetical protein